MSEEKTDQQVEEINEINEEVGKEPVPFNFFMPMVKALENRIDYNFNTIIQLSLLLEYLYENLEKHDIKIELNETFEKFQETRLEEMKQEFLKKAQESSEDDDIDLKDD